MYERTFRGIKEDIDFGTKKLVKESELYHSGRT